MGAHPELEEDDMKSPRETCSKRSQCGPTGHTFNPKTKAMDRCKCLELEILQRQLGAMYTPTLMEETPLSDMTGRDLLIEGPLASVRSHVAPCLLSLSKGGETWTTMDAYRLIEIYLRQDEEHESNYFAVETDLLILLVGFADPRNRMLPELILQVLNRRELLHKPTWVILGLPQETISTKYSTALADKLSTHKKVRIE